MKVQNIRGADMYRDGGSYGFLLSSDNGHRHEFFLQTRFPEQPRPQESHHPPVIYLGSRNDDKPVQQLTWEEAEAFIAPLHFKGRRFQNEGQRFQEFVAIVMREGRRQSGPREAWPLRGRPQADFAHLHPPVTSNVRH